MNSFIRNVCLFILFVLSVVLIQFFTFRFLLSRQVDYKLNASINTVIIGNSQPQTSIDDSIINNGLNIALGGDPLYFSYIKLKKILPHNPQVKNVILGGLGSIYDGGFYEVPRMESKFKLYYYITDISDYWDFLKYNPEAFLTGMTGIVYKIKPKKLYHTRNVTDLSLGGYGGGMEREFQLDDIKKFNKDDYSHLKVTPIQAKYLHQIVVLCRAYHVKIIVLDCPIHPLLVSLQKNGRKQYLHDISKALPDAEFWDYENFPLSDAEYGDCIHLNKKGAKVFSSVLKKRIDALPQ